MVRGPSSCDSAPAGFIPGRWRRVPTWKPSLQGATSEPETSTMAGSVGPDLSRASCRVDSDACSLSDLSTQAEEPAEPSVAASTAAPSQKLTLPVAKREAWCDIEDEDADDMYSDLPSVKSLSEFTPSKSSKRADRRRRLRAVMRDEAADRPKSEAAAPHIDQVTFDSPEALATPTHKASPSYQAPVPAARPVPPPPPSYSPRLRPSQAPQQEEFQRRSSVIMSTSPIAGCTEGTRPAAFLPPGALGYCASPVASPAPRPTAGFWNASLRSPLPLPGQGTPVGGDLFAGASPKAAFGADASARTPMGGHTAPWAAASPIAAASPVAPAQSPTADALRVLLGSHAMVSSKELAARLMAAVPETYED
eukprot:TRINITY_DN28875_c0_g1_i1.p1 TRINITY_DN28875_c0_g1~~TRINITY_DN28875_c0_g1_i1.p1  ORF type:complete len:365 (+),score=67.34 TRINITY_DN28875_c0_g1_i1:112-1206(+)